MVLLANPGLPLWPYLVCAALAGLGGGNFASSMTNINAFYPQRLKGWALALNAGGGNLGVPIVQLVGLLVIATVGNRQPYWVCAVYLVLLAVAAIGAALYMDNLQHYQIQLSTMRAVLAERHTWVIAAALHRYLRLVHRFLVRVRAGAADQFHCQRPNYGARLTACRPDRFCGAAIGFAVAGVRRQARRPHRWRPRHPRRLLRHDPGGRNPGQRQALSAGTTASARRPRRR